MGFFARVKDNNPACMIPNGKHIASIVEFNDTYDVFFLNFFTLTLLSEDLEEFVI
jgi:hypothetical protein